MEPSRDIPRVEYTADPGRNSRGIKPYSYKNLGCTATSIRILELLPAKSKDELLRGHLRTESLPMEITSSNVEVNGSLETPSVRQTTSAPLTFETLSYTWGSEEKPYGISIDGDHLSIGSNLFTALQHFRSSDAVRRLWVDAVCINQADNSERTDQVVIMPYIYARARRTLSWLGEDSPEHDGRRSMHFLDWFANYETPLKHYAASMVVSGPHDTPLRDILQQYNAQVSPNDSVTLDQIETFCNNPYFSRRWIVQEVGVASTVEFCCGDARILGSRLARAAGYMLTEDSPLRISQPFMRLLLMDVPSLTRPYGQNLSKFFSGSGMLSERVRNDERVSVLTALEMFQSFQCRDPRDRIASLTWWGAKLNISKSFWIDYSVSVETEYARFATFIAVSCKRENQNLGTLSCLLLSAARRQHSESVPRGVMPTWVPDWRLQAREYEARITRAVLTTCGDVIPVTLLRGTRNAEMYSRPLSFGQLEVRFRKFEQGRFHVRCRSQLKIEHEDVLIDFSGISGPPIPNALGGNRDIILVFRRQPTVPETWAIKGALAFPAVKYSRYDRYRRFRLADFKEVTRTFVLV